MPYENIGKGTALKMTVTELKAKIKNSDITGAYIFCGEEDYLKKYYLSEFVKLSCPDDAFSLFNRVTFDGEDISIEEIEEALKSPPMMSDIKLVEWRYADIEHLPEAEKKKLEDLAASLSDYPYASLVIFADAEGFIPGTLKKPSKLMTRFSKCFSIINFEKSTDVQLISWLGRHFASRNVSVDSDTLSALIFRAGHSMEILKNETDKLSAYAGANNLTRITKSEVELVTASTVECDAFALSDAISNKNKEKAFLALADMQQRRIDARVVFGALSKSLTEILTVAYMLKDGKDIGDIENALHWNAYRIKICVSSAKKWGDARLSSALSRLRELDAKSKRGGISGYKMLEMFICQCL